MFRSRHKMLRPVIKCGVVKWLPSWFEIVTHTTTLLHTRGASLCTEAAFNPALHQMPLSLRVTSCPWLSPLARPLPGHRYEHEHTLGDRVWTTDYRYLNMGDTGTAPACAIQPSMYLMYDRPCLCFKFGVMPSLVFSPSVQSHAGACVLQL